MVSKDIVESAIYKCSYKSQLSKYSASEKRELLEDKCNEAELQEYDMYKEWLDDDLEKLFQLNKEDSLDKAHQRYVDELHHRINRFEKKLYNYEKRIVNGYTLSNNPVPVIDKNKFKEDDNGDRGGGVSSAKGELEQKQIDSQEEHGYSDFEKNGMDEWFGYGHNNINRSLYEKDFYKEWLDDVEKKRVNSAKRAISSAIHKSNGLIQDTLMFHGGRFDISLNPGDHFNWNGYLSLSYNEGSADRFVSYGFMYKCYVPMGTKGVAGNDKQLNNHMQTEHEYLLDKGTGATVLNVDYENRIVEVLID